MNSRCSLCMVTFSMKNVLVSHHLNALLKTSVFFALVQKLKIPVDLRICAENENTKWGHTGKGCAFFIHLKSCFSVGVNAVPCSEVSFEINATRCSFQSLLNHQRPLV